MYFSCVACQQKHKVVYVFFKKNLILDLEVIYKNSHKIEYGRVPREIVSIYHFGGLLLFDAIGGVKVAKLVVSAQSHPQINVTHHQPTISVKLTKKLVSQGTLLPTSVVRVGK